MILSEQRDRRKQPKPLPPYPHSVDLAYLPSTCFQESDITEPCAHPSHAALIWLIHARDIGVSYFLVGVMGVLAYHIARPWRWGYIGVLFVIFGFPLLTMDSHELNFTAIGHFASLLIGLCFYRMAQERRRPLWSPGRVKGAVQRLLSRPQS